MIFLILLTFAEKIFLFDKNMKLWYNYPNIHYVLLGVVAVDALIKNINGSDLIWILMQLI